VKAVIIGTSGHIDLALSVRDRLPRLRFVGIAPGSPDEDTKGFFIEQMEPALIPFYDDFRAMLDREKPDVAVVAPYFFLQAQVACECMERGINVFVEKPMAPTLEELDRLRRVHAKSGVALCPMLPARYHPEFMAAFRAVKEGLIGEPLLITAHKSYKLGFRHAMYTRRASYGGTIPWVALPAIDWVYWFCGGRILEVSASHTTDGNRGHGELESSGICFFRLANSGAAAVSFDYFRPSAAPGHGEERLRVAGEKGIVEVTGTGATIVTEASEPRRLARQESRSVFEEFVLSLSGEAGLRIGAEEAFEVSELALKSREAADTGRAVEFRGTSRWEESQ
jgi:predicted dehydrogenase